MEQNDLDITEEKENYLDELKKLKIFFYLNINDNVFILPIETDYFSINNQSVYELIKNIVKKINEKKIVIKIKSINYLISLQDIEDEDDYTFYINNYEIKPCKKRNHYPKDDSPNYSYTTLLKNIEFKNISFMSKNPLNIMLREIEQTNNENRILYQEDDEY